MVISSITSSPVTSYRSDPSASSAGQPQPVSQAADASQKQASAQPSLEQVQKATEQINKVVQGLDKNLQFAVDHDSGRVVVKVMDTEKKELIRQIPSEETLSIAKALDKLQGLLIKQTA